jgi:L-ascorbate metabolism protein UlaG (beta-lactamase superfamily)
MKALASIRHVMIIFLSIIAFLAAIGFLYLQQPLFGKAPSGKRLEAMQKSPNFKNGIFHNRSFTPSLTEGYTIPGLLFDFLFTKYPRTRPTDVIPSIKTDLHKLSLNTDVLVWFGHSSYYMQLAGKRFLVDPVFSGNASPIPGTNKSFSGTDVYSAADIPEIDYLLITHDHYDHLDYKTILQLKRKVKVVICGLGVGSHFERWGFTTQNVIEKDWDEQVSLDNNLTVYTATARHFSGRSFTRNNTLWLSFILKTPELKIYIGGDSGFDKHFAEIGQKYGGFDLAILENGQYNKAWEAIHLFPESGLQAADDLNAKRLFPVHSSKFKLAHHPWDEPLVRITAANKNSIPLVTPIIGEVVYLRDEKQPFDQWWLDIN